ncbi:hypothetical protein KKG71_00735 [Patescibacteria group bacterium]|nr:hypothetical protein [Patescibacteria group bacterium]
MNEKQKIYGLIEFSQELLCAADSLGCSVDIELANYTATLTLPFLPNWDSNEKDPLNKCLIGPKPADKWKRGDEIIFWGKPTSYPNGNSYVNYTLLEFSIDSTIIDAATQAIYSSFPAWLNLFEKYVMLLTKQHTRNQIYGADGHARLELLLDDANKLKYISSKTSNSIQLIIDQEDVSLHYAQFVEASKLSSKLLKPRLEYQLLLDAYIARRNHDFRKVIIEGASALEVCLTTRIQEEFDSQGIKFGKKLLDKFRMLSGRFELVRVLGIELPDKDYNTIIINPRNDVVHRASYPDRKTTELFINEVESLMNLFTPQLYEI